MESIFLLKKDGDCLGEIDRGDDIEKNILVKVFIKHFFSSKENKQNKKELRGLKKEMQSRDNADLFWEDIKKFKKLGYLPYVFNGRKKDIARLLLKMPLDGKERLEFLDKLTNVPEEKMEDLHKSISEDFKKVMHFR